MDWSIPGQKKKKDYDQLFIPFPNFSSKKKKKGIKCPKEKLIPYKLVPEDRHIP